MNEDVKTVNEQILDTIKGHVLEALKKQPKSKSINSIGLFIDGQYYFRLDKALEDQNRHVRLKGLIGFIEKTIAVKYGLDRDSCVVTETHFFRGRLKTNAAKEAKGGLEAERKFEDRLVENDVVLHYKHVYYLPDGKPHEKAIDVWFALETFELALYRDFDFIVMITGDADYEMLARKIKSLKKPAILLSWHYDEQDPTARDLRDEISFQININSLLQTNPGLFNIITESASL